MQSNDVIRAGEVLELRGDMLEAAASYAALNDPSPAVVGDARFHLGRVHFRQSKYAEAAAEFEQARAIALQHEILELRARVENGLGAVHYARGEYTRAKACYSVALDVTTDPVQRARVLLNLGIIANIEGDFELARTYYNRSSASAQQGESPLVQAMALHNLGMLNADEGRWDDAEDAYSQCVDLFEQLGDAQSMAAVLVNRSELSCARERYDEAVANCDLALSMYAELGDEAGRGEALRWKGRGLKYLGRRDESERVLHEAVRVAKRTGVRLLEAEASLDLGLSHADRGDGPQARRWLNRALELFESLGAQRDAEAVRVALAAWANRD
jgi:tetratricopeptide (TPR) repeat protein